MASDAEQSLGLAFDIARAVRDASGPSTTLRPGSSTTLRPGRALIVGGWVRDRLLGIESKDIDLEVYGVPADRLKDLLSSFGRVDTVGESFTVYKVGGLDVSLPRRESKVARGHKGFVVTGDPWLPFVEAFRRRDFTINAVGWDPLTDEYIDPFGGREDLRKRVLRMVDAARFGDDSLRVLRAVQFAARFELQIDGPTAALCREIPLDDLPAERIWAELEKLLLRAPRPSIGFNLARELGVTVKLFPELEALYGCPQEPEWHPEGDVWVHTLMVIDQARTRIDDLTHACKVALMLGAVCHDFGKPATTAFIDGRIRSLEHEPMGIEPATCFLDKLNVHTLDGYDVRFQVLGMTAHHLKPGAFSKARDTVTDGAFRRLAQRVDLELLARLAKSDCTGRTGDFDCSAMDWFLERARALGVEHEPPKPLVLGRHLLALGMTPGPKVGQILKQIYEKQLDGEITTTEEGIDLARTLITALG
ncbi:MAG: CCA tRNA nucleotidyltransferase [Acidobacteriota bacterium]